MRAQTSAFRPRFEQLEAREVPSAGMLDPSFSGDGIATASFGTTYALGHDVAVLADGSVIAVGGNGFSSPPSFALAKFRPDGSPDPTFGSGGQVVTNVGSLSDQANCVAVQTDGKIVVGGYTNAGKSDLYTSGKRNYAFALVRYHPNGALDTSFGKSGVVKTDLDRSSDDQIHELVLRPDGKIVVVGQSGVNMAVARYTTAGQLDPTFDGDGILVVPKLNVGEVLNAVALLPDGRIVASGNHVAVATQTVYDNRGLLVRFGENGGLDSTFGTGGRVLTSYDTGGFTAVAIRPDGRIVAGGSTTTSTHFIAQYTAAGAPDTTFGDDPDGDGVRTGSILAPLDTAWITDLAIDSAGRIVEVGAVQNPSPESPTVSADFDFAVFRYTADGRLDDSFGTGGISIADPTGTDREMFSAVALMADGRIVAVGSAYDYVGQRTIFAVARYLGD